MATPRRRSRERPTPSRRRASGSRNSRPYSLWIAPSHAAATSHFSTSGTTEANIAGRACRVRWSSTHAAASTLMIRTAAADCCATQASSMRLSSPRWKERGNAYAFDRTRGGASACCESTSLSAAKKRDAASESSWEVGAIGASSGATCCAVHPRSSNWVSAEWRTALTASSPSGKSSAWSGHVRRHRGAAGCSPPAPKRTAASAASAVLASAATSCRLSST